MKADFQLSNDMQFKIISLGHGDQPDVVIESLNHPGYQSRRTCMPASDASLCVGDVVEVKNHSATSLWGKRCSDGAMFLLYGDKRW